MKILGVTGPSGAGKSVFCGYLSGLGCEILDCDAIYHELTDKPSACTQELSLDENFGTKILKTDGSLDRRALASVVFNESPEAKEKLLKLNEISHRYVTEYVLSKLEALRNQSTPVKCAVIDAPLLFQAGMHKICDMTLALLADPKTRLERLSERDMLPAEALEARLAAAPDDAFFSEKADVTLVNDGSLEKLKNSAAEIINNLCG